MRNLDFITFFEGRIVNDARQNNIEDTTLFFFTVAIDKGYRNKTTGAWIEKTKYVECCLKCKSVQTAKIEYLSQKLLLKGYKVKGCGEFGEPQVDIDKKTGEAYKTADGKYKASILFFIEDMKLVAKPNGNPVPVDGFQPTVQDDPSDDLPF